jgi:hypothetical protein
MQACFASEDLAALFQNVRGKQTVEVLLNGALNTGGKFLGSLDLVVIGTGRKVRPALVWPNPLNPEGVLSFQTSKPGAAKLALFDLGGRLVRTLLEVPALAAGAHNVRIDGRGSHGEALASGVYFYRIQAVDGITTGRFTILK